MGILSDRRKCLQYDLMERNRTLNINYVKYEKKSLSKRNERKYTFLRCWLLGGYGWGLGYGDIVFF